MTEFLIPLDPAITAWAISCIAWFVMQLAFKLIKHYFFNRI
jgi:hypothetical protein